MSFSLGSASRSRLARVHPDLVACVERAIRTSAVDFTVMQGLRTLSEQARHVAAGTSRTMASRHLLQPDGHGHAVDLVPWVGGADGHPEWDWEGCYAIAAAMRLAASGHGVKLVWGGVWDRPLTDIDAADAAGMKAAHLNYVRAWEKAHPGRRALQDGPHFEIAS
jgi:peptidoglycan L-alanyl-D-glutamate endopeptidase CwlK